MKSRKSVFAIIGIVLLGLLYITTLIVAIFDPTPDKSYFKACLFLCIAVPVLLYAYILAYKHMRDKRHKED
ncbi:MAG: hypothetical protein IJW18_08295 [Lachnospiraceae bacterium]|nr:hypothetical protein [Lachnospiraceae bacterium]